jgi:hypothetical protein
VLSGFLVCLSFLAGFLLVAVFLPLECFLGYLCGGGCLFQFYSLSSVSRVSSLSEFSSDSSENNAEVNN